MASQSPPTREGLTFSKVSRFLTLPFFPSKSKPYLAVKKFEDINPESLFKDGVKGLLLDADGTLGTHKTERFPQSSVDHVKLLKASGLRIAIFTNSIESRFQQFEGIPVVKDVAAKPDKSAFITAAKHFLEINDPQTVCMVGDSFITDGGAVETGMRFIYVDPIPGKENIFHRFTRKIAFWIAKIYFPDRFK